MACPSKCVTVTVERPGVKDILGYTLKGLVLFRDKHPELWRSVGYLDVMSQVIRRPLIFKPMG